MNDEGLPEAEAVAFVRENNLHGRMITWFDWGEYAIWFGRPELRVSLDGRRETVYSEAVVDEQLAFARGDASAAGVAERYGADWIWLPTEAAVLPSLVGGESLELAIEEADIRARSRDLSGQVSDRESIEGVTLRREATNRLVDTVQVGAHASTSFLS